MMALYREKYGDTMVEIQKSVWDDLVNFLKNEREVKKNQLENLNTLLKELSGK